MNPCKVSVRILALLVLQSGCQRAPAVARLEGASTFRIIEPPAPPARSGTPTVSAGPFEPTDVVVAAEPLAPLSTPVFPRAALGKLRAPVLVGVQIVVDASGNVARIGPSLRALTTAGSLSADFLTAVDEAVAQWRFRPAEKRWMKPMKGSLGQEDFWLITRVEKTEYAFDVSFAFTVSGDITSKLAK
jgi:hypothetical protein